MAIELSLLELNCRGGLYGGGGGSEKLDPLLSPESFFENEGELVNVELRLISIFLFLQLAIYFGVIYFILLFLGALWPLLLLIYLLFRSLVIIIHGKFPNIDDVGN